MSRQEQKNRNFLTELAVGSKKIAIFYRKMEKTARRRATKRRITQFSLIVGRRNAKKQQKQLVVGRRNTENDKNCLSSADEMKNTAKTARRRPTKRKITRFLSVARERNAESPVFYSSLASETQNQPKTAFPPGGKIKNAQFLRFPLEGKSKTPNFCVSP